MRAVLEYELPRDQAALEAAIMGPETSRVITRLRAHLERERLEHEKKVREGARTMSAQSELVGYLRGLSDALAELEQLVRGTGEEGRRIDADE